MIEPLPAAARPFVAFPALLREHGIAAAPEQTTSFLMAILFFGGYRFFGLEQVSPFLSVAVIIFKAFVGYFIIMWVKYTLLRIRIDHMLAPAVEGAG